MTMMHDLSRLAMVLMAVCCIAALFATYVAFSSDHHGWAFWFGSLAGLFAFIAREWRRIA